MICQIKGMEIMCFMPSLMTRKKTGCGWDKRKSTAKTIGQINRSGRSILQFLAECGQLVNGLFLALFHWSSGRLFLGHLFVHGCLFSYLVCFLPLFPSQDPSPLV